MPYAFTEHGAIMAAMVLNSPLAVDMSVHIVRAFVRLRELIASNKELAKRLPGSKFGTRDRKEQHRLAQRECRLRKRLGIKALGHGRGSRTARLIG